MPADREAALAARSAKSARPLLRALVVNGGDWPKLMDEQPQFEGKSP